MGGDGRDRVVRYKLDNLLVKVKIRYVAEEGYIEHETKVRINRLDDVSVSRFTDNKIDKGEIKCNNKS